MVNTVKSLVHTCQETLAKSLDGLSEIGFVPYSLIKPSLLFATPQQLYKIEKANPEITKESDELWLKHCLIFRDIKEEYERGFHQDPKKWREIYLERYNETERKRQLVKEKVKSQYSKIQNEKEKKSIKVLSGVVPIKGRKSYEAARRSTMSKLFLKTKKETDKIVSIYQAPKRTPPVTLNRSSPLINSLPPRPRIEDSIQDKKRNSPITVNRSSTPIYLPSSRPIKKPRLEDSIEKRNMTSNRSLTTRPLKKPKLEDPIEDKKKKPTAIVNFNIFNELS